MFGFRIRVRSSWSQREPTMTGDSNQCFHRCHPSTLPPSCPFISLIEAMLLTHPQHLPKKDFLLNLYFEFPLIQGDCTAICHHSLIPEREMSDINITQEALLSSGKAVSSDHKRNTIIGILILWCQRQHEVGQDSGKWELICVVITLCTQGLLFAQTIS